jgi:hypothetical protein
LGGCGTLLAALILWLEWRASKFAAQAVTAVCGFLFLCMAAACAFQGGPQLAAVALLLAGACLVVAATRSATVRRWVAASLVPRNLAIVLLVACPLAARHIAFQANAPVGTFELPPSMAVDYRLVEGISAITDEGSVLPVFHYDPVQALEEAEHALLALEQYQLHVIRLSGPSDASNCHGWVFTGGQYGIRGPDVENLLADNGYQVAAEPQVGDLAVFREMDGKIAHTAVVRIAEPSGLLVVESKWGPLGVYLHPVTSQPYGDRYAFYRSSRAGHLVSIDTGDPVADQRVAALGQELFAETGSLLDPAAPPDAHRNGLLQMRERPLEANSYFHP